MRSKAFWYLAVVLVCLPVLSSRAGLRSIFREQVTSQPSTPLVGAGFGIVAFPAAHDTAVFDINDLGQIVGSYVYPSTDPDHGFLLDDTSFNKVDFPGAAVTLVTAINSVGDMVGAYVDSTRRRLGFKLSGSTFTSIDFPGATIITPTGINTSGQIVGAYADATGNHAFSLIGDSFSSIDFPGAIDTQATGIDSAGNIVGFYVTASDRRDHGFVLRSDGFTTIDFPGAVHSWISGINDSGQMVGAYGDGTIILRFLEHHAFLFSGGTFTSFDAPFAGRRITPFARINNSGQIAGYYLDADGTYFGYVVSTAGLMPN